MGRMCQLLLWVVRGTCCYACYGWPQCHLTGLPRSLAHASCCLPSPPPTTSPPPRWQPPSPHGTRPQSSPSSHQPPPPPRLPAAAFATWHQATARERLLKAAAVRVAGRWRNLHLASAFGTWRAWAHQRRQLSIRAGFIAQRWRNLHLAAAFGAWRERALRSSYLQTAGQHVAARWLHRGLAGERLAVEGRAPRGVGVSTLLFTGIISIGMQCNTVGASTCQAVPGEGHSRAYPRSCIGFEPISSCPGVGDDVPCTGVDAGAFATWRNWAQHQRHTRLAGMHVAARWRNKHVAGEWQAGDGGGGGAWRWCIAHAGWQTLLSTAGCCQTVTRTALAPCPAAPIGYRIPPCHRTTPTTCRRL